jgi:hypothetical protein
MVLARRRLDSIPIPSRLEADVELIVDDVELIVDDG